MEPKIPDVRTPMQRGCFTDLLKGRSREVTDVSAVTTPQSRPHLFAIEGRSSKMVNFSRTATAENPEIVNDGDEVLEGRDPVVDFLTTGLPYEDPDCADTADRKSVV